MGEKGKMQNLIFHHILTNYYKTILKLSLYLYSILKLNNLTKSNKIYYN